MTQRFSVALCSLFTVLAFIGCDPTAPASSADRAHDNAHLPPGDAEQGKALAERSSCAECHGPDYSGSGFYPNLTPAMGVGLGAWTNAQIAAAIRDGMYDDGTALCGLMERFPFSDQEVADVIAYLRSLPSVTKAAAGECPGHGG